MPDIDKFTGAVNINGDLTPITRQKIETVTAERWTEMNNSELHDQRIILNNRMNMAYNSGQAAVAQQIQAGINTIEALLSRTADTAQKRTI